MIASNVPGDSDVQLALELSKKFDELQNEQDYVEDGIVQLYEQLYNDYPISYGKALSRKERQENGYVSTCLVYGEITFKPFALMFRRLYEFGLPADGGKFVDIGSGTGKAVFAAALLHDFESCVGIEILDGLHEVSQNVLHNWQKTIRYSCSRSKFDMDIKFLHGDATHIYWTDADLVFANSTCFDEKLMKQVAETAKHLRQGALLLTTSKRLPSPDFELVQTLRMEESWGAATTFVQRKTTARPATHWTRLLA